MFALKNIRNKARCFDVKIYLNLLAPTSKVLDNNKYKHMKVFKTEQNLNYFEDSDSFGSLSGKLYIKSEEVLEDEGDIKEQKFLENSPLPIKKLTIKQYADIIKQYLKHKRLKEAINVLEERMLKEDRVYPENYIYNILIGACAEFGYTKKAFKLYNDMKRRALKPTGDTYTCLFEACINSPWPADGLKNAKHLRELMIEKGIEPNLTNYNVMIKAFGRCGDLPMAFKIVDEMISKKIKIRVHTFNHLLHACISDSENGLRHALLVWRKMLIMNERPNIYSFNLMLKCVKECNLGTREDIIKLIESIHDHTLLYSSKVKRLQNETMKNIENLPALQSLTNFSKQSTESDVDHLPCDDISRELIIAQDQSSDSITLLPKDYKSIQREKRNVPNLLSRFLHLNEVFSLKEVNKVQDKFAIIGGQEDFLKEMELMSVKPDIKTFTQMLPLLEESREAENKVMETMKFFNVKTDIDFFNMLIKKRCLRKDYDGAFLIKDLIDNNLKTCKKKYQYKKAVKCNILTYGVLAMACNTKDSAEKLLKEMAEKQLKVNIEILGTLLRQGTAQMKFEYIMYIMDVVNQEKLYPNEVFSKHLEVFNDKCGKVVKQNQNMASAYKIFVNKYKIWLKYIKALKREEEHPWKQFMESHPETVQRDHFQIKEPKRFYKRNRKFICYVPKV